MPPLDLWRAWHACHSRWGPLTTAEAHEGEVRSPPCHRLPWRRGVITAAAAASFFARSASGRVGPWRAPGADWRAHRARLWQRLMTLWRRCCAPARDKSTKRRRWEGDIPGPGRPLAAATGGRLCRQDAPNMPPPAVHIAVAGDHSADAKSAFANVAPARELGRYPDCRRAGSEVCHV